MKMKPKKTLAVAAAIASCAFAVHAAPCGAETLRECSWMFGHETWYVDGPTNKWGLPPAVKYYHQVRACIDFGIPSLAVAGMDDPGEGIRSAKFRSSLSGLKRVSFNVSTNKEDPDYHLRLADWAIETAKETPNMTAIDFDDFFRTYTRAAFTVAEMKDIRRRAKALERPLEMRLIAYDFQFRRDPNLGKDPSEMLPYYEQFDSVELWTWCARDIKRLPESLAGLKKLAPDKTIILGIYLWDFGMKKEMPAEDMKFQLDFALEKWKAREIEGVMFLATSICNRDFPAVILAREWIKANGDCTR